MEQSFTIKRISVEDRLPEPDVPVLVWYEEAELKDRDSFVGIGKWYPKRDRMWAVTAGPRDWFWTRADRIVYWHPLPSPPDG